MPQATRLALCLENIRQCNFMRVYSVWKKTYWKKGERKNQHTFIVLDNTSMQRFRFDSDTFHKHFKLLDKNTIKPTLWKKIKAAQQCAKKKPRLTKKLSNG
jgi:hypothetical protein